MSTFAESCPHLSRFLSMFPFADEASRAHALASVITLMSPKLLGLETPLIVLQGPPASGKSLFVQSLGRLATSFDDSPSVLLYAHTYTASSLQVRSGFAGRGVVTVRGLGKRIQLRGLQALENALKGEKKTLNPHLICVEACEGIRDEVYDRALLIELEAGRSCPQCSPLDFAADHQAVIAVEVWGLIVRWRAEGYDIDEDLAVIDGSMNRCAKLLWALNQILKTADVPGFLGNKVLASSFETPAIGEMTVTP